MSKGSEPRCGNCRFYRCHEVLWQGYCMRHAPRPTLFLDDSNQGPNATVVWPDVCEGDWCGEWEAAGPEHMKRKLEQAVANVHGARWMLEEAKAGRCAEDIGHLEAQLRSAERELQEEREAQGFPRTKKPKAKP